MWSGLLLLSFFCKSYLKVLFTLSCWQFLSIWWALQLHLAITGHSAITCPTTEYPPPLLLLSTTAHMVDRNRIVSCLFGCRPSWNYAPPLDWRWGCGLFFLPQEKKSPLRPVPFRMRVQFPLRQALVVVGPAGLRKTRNRARQSQSERTETDRKEPLSCDYESSREHLTFPVADRVSLTTSTGSSRLLGMLEWCWTWNNLDNNNTVRHVMKRLQRLSAWLMEVRRGGSRARCLHRFQTPPHGNGAQLTFCFSSWKYFWPTSKFALIHHGNLEGIPKMSEAFVYIFFCAVKNNVLTRYD